MQIMSMSRSKSWGREVGYKITERLVRTTNGPGIAPVLPQFGLTPTDLFVLYAVAYRENDINGGPCRAGIQRLAMEAGVSTHTAQRSLSKLVDKKLVIEERRWRGLTSYRSINMERLEEMEAAVPAVVEALKASQQAGPSVTTAYLDGDDKPDTDLDMSKVALSDEEL